MKFIRAASVLSFSLFAAAAHAASYTWNGASGLLPSEVSPPFSLVDTASPEQPTLSGGVLTLSGNLIAETMYYIVSGDSIDLPDHLVVDFRMRFVSGNTSEPYRAPAGVAITTANGVGVSLWIDRDEAFLLSGFQTVGDRSTSIDTDAAFHDYRIVITGRDAGSGVSVWYDGMPLLTGQTFASTAANGTVPRVLFGEFSIQAAGVTEWQSFSVSAVPEAGSGVLAGIGVLALGLLRRRGVPRGAR